jgi:hypothetical protein
MTMQTRPRPYPPSFGVGERNSRARLTEADVREIRRRYAEGGGGNVGGISQRELAEEYEVTRCCIWRILHRATWRHV